MCGCFKRGMLHALTKLLPGELSMCGLAGHDDDGGVALMFGTGCILMQRQLADPLSSSPGAASFRLLVTC
jgi:hypothetical protein